jgi:protein SCO1/2
MNSRRFLLWLALAAVGGLLAGALAAHMLSQRSVALQGGTWLPEPRALPAVRLDDCNGRVLDASSLRGHPALLFFGYSRCPDVCPTTLATLQAVLQRARLPGLRVLFITVDPRHDTPAVLRQYLATFGPQFTGLQAQPADLARLLRELGASAGPEAAGNGYTIAHSATLYLLDTRGRLVAVFTPPLSAALLAADLQRAARADAL